MNEEYSRNPSGTAQDAAPVGDGDDGSMFDTDHTPSSKRDNSTDVSGNSSPTNSQCDSFQSIQLLKSRPLHLAVFLHHVITQFDPAPLLCYLYAELYKQTNSKENRRVLTKLHTFFIDRGANLKVAVPESVSADLACRRTESTLEEINRHVQTLQDSLDANIQKNLEDFRQKRNMGLTLAEVELARLDQRVRDHLPLERPERAYADKIITKIEDVLKKEKEKEKEEEKCSIMQYVILTYMKHLGVRDKEPRSPEPKWRFLPKKKIIKTEKEGEEKVKKPSFPSIRGPQPSRVEAASGGTPTSSRSKLSDSLQSDHLDVDPLDQLQEEDRESDRLEGLGATNVQSEDNQATDLEHHPWYSKWQQLVGGEVLAGLTPHEIQRQEVIHELLNTERAHVRALRALDRVFFQMLSKEATLPPTDIKNLFTNPEEILQLHVSIEDQMVAIQKRNESAVIAQIGDDLHSWFSGGQEEKIKQVVGTFCSNQALALEIIMTRQEKDSPFTSFKQEAENKRQCRRQQLKDIIRIEMQRLTKYPLLLDGIAKYTDDAVEKDKVKQAGECCRRIFNHVNQAVKESDDKQRLEDYQRRLDRSTLKKTDPMILELKNLDLTKKTMVHEGPLSWKVNKDKTIELNTLLLEDILVLLQKQDEHLILKCVKNRMSKKLVATANTKDIFSPIIKLNTVLSVRPVATDNKSFFVISMSENGERKTYELMAPTVSDQRTWLRLITQRADAMKVKPDSVIPLPRTEDGVEIVRTGVSRLAKGADRTSTGSTERSPAPSGMTQSSLLGNNPFEEVKMEEGEEEAFVDPELPYQAAEDSGEGDSFNLFPSSLTRAEKALKELASLKQVFVTIMSQEASERTHRSSILRTTSVQTPVDSRARVLVDTGSEKSLTQAEDPAQDLASGDTGFFDSPEDYAGCPVLEGYGGPGEGTINDDIMAVSTGKQLSTSQDSGINLRFSSASAAGSLSSFRGQVLGHLRNLQSDLNYLKEVEYNNIISQSPERSPSDAYGNKELDMTWDQRKVFLNMTHKMRETDRYMEEIKKLTQDLDDVISERHNLERELRCSHEETEQKDEELRKKKKEWDDATSENTKLERKLDDMNQQMTEKERELQDATKQMEESKVQQQKLQDLTNKVVMLTVQLQERERELENIKRTLIEKDEELRKMNKELDDVISDKSHVEDGENTDSTFPPKTRDGMEGPADSAFTTKNKITITFQEAEKWLMNVRTEFVNRVSEPILESLLDELLRMGVINGQEMEKVQKIQENTNKARAIIDSVRNKGKAASLKMIGVLQEKDPNLSGHLCEFHRLYKETEPQMKITIQRHTEEKRHMEEQEMIERFEKELKNSLGKMDGSIHELKGGIRKIAHQLTDMKTQKKEVKDEEKKRELEQEQEQMKRDLETFKTEQADEIRKREEKHRQEIEKIRKSYEGERRARVEAEMMEVVLPEFVSNIMISKTKMQKDFERQLDEKNIEMTTQLEKLDKKNKEMTAQLENLRIAAQKPAEGVVTRLRLEKEYNSLMTQAETVQELLRKSHRH